MQGINDALRLGRPVKVLPVHETLLLAKLAEDRLWTTAQLAEVLEKEFKLQITAQTVRQHLSALGHSWKRARHAPGKPLAPQVEQLRALANLALGAQVIGPLALTLIRLFFCQSRAEVILRVQTSLLSLFGLSFLGFLL